MAVAGHMFGRMFEHYHHVRTTAKRAALERLERGSSLSDSDGGRSRARTADLLLVRDEGGPKYLCFQSVFTAFTARVVRACWRQQ